MTKQKYTSFSKIYDSFYSKITDDMYLELNEAETAAMARELLLSAVHKFEFPRQPLIYKVKHHMERDAWGNTYMEGAFKGRLIPEEINILATYMVVEWLGQQLATIENTRMKYSGSDFKFTSQANHMQKILLLKKDYEREGFHLQRLYKRRVRDKNGVFHSTLSKIMEPDNTNWEIGDGWPVDEHDHPGPCPPPGPPRDVADGLEWHVVTDDDWDDDDDIDEDDWDNDGTFVCVDDDWDEDIPESERTPDCHCHPHHNRITGIKWFGRKDCDCHEGYIVSDMGWNPKEPRPRTPEEEFNDW